MCTMCYLLLPIIIIIIILLYRVITLTTCNRRCVRTADKKKKKLIHATRRTYIIMYLCEYARVSLFYIIQPDLQDLFVFHIFYFRFFFFLSNIHRVLNIIKFYKLITDR